MAAVMELIRTRAELYALAKRLGVRPDWHEPDEQGVDAFVVGEEFDNAGFWPAGLMPTYDGPVEKHVVITKGDERVAAVNLATLLAMAASS